MNETIAQALSGFIDLSTGTAKFPDSFLDANGYTKQLFLWDDAKPFSSIQTDSGFEIHVVNNEEVYLERFGKLTRLNRVTTGSELLDLFNLLGC